VPLTVVPLVITGAGCTTEITKVAEPVPVELTALIVALVVPVDVGEPVIAPVLVFTLKPPGRPLAPKLAGLLLAVIW
jgi:hypothetical protein